MGMGKWIREPLGQALVDADARAYLLASGCCLVIFGHRQLTEENMMLIVSFEKYGASAPNDWPIENGGRLRRRPHRLASGYGVPIQFTSISAFGRIGL
jgi:hypothetical protein